VTTAIVPGRGGPNLSRQCPSRQRDQRSYFQTPIAGWNDTAWQQVSAIGEAAILVEADCCR
jgi:hypothetical protein